MKILDITWATGAPSGDGPKSMYVPGDGEKTGRRELVCDGKRYGVIYGFVRDGVQHFAALYSDEGHADRADWIEVPTQTLIAPAPDPMGSSYDYEHRGCDVDDKSPM